MTSFHGIFGLPRRHGTVPPLTLKPLPHNRSSSAMPHARPRKKTPFVSPWVQTLRGVQDGAERGVPVEEEEAPEPELGPLANRGSVRIVC